MSVLTQKTLQAITAKHIRPISPWVSRLKNGLFWSGALLLVSFSAVATAVSWHVIFEIDWRAYQDAHFSWLEICLSGVPLFSLLLLVVFILVSIVLLYQTRRGYRYPMLLLTGVFLASSLACGYFLEESPFDQSAERLLLRAFPYPEGIQATLVPTAERQWSQPERGLLGGVVQSSDVTGMTLLDASQKLWTVNYSQAVDTEVKFAPQEQVKVIGNQDGVDTFQATQVRVWEQSRSDRREEARKKSREESAAKREKESSDAIHNNDTSVGTDDGSDQPEDGESEHESEGADNE